MNLVRFAGFDPREGVRRNTKAARAYDLFDLGWNTIRIAERLNVTEAKALKLVNQERSRLLGRADPFGENAA